LVSPREAEEADAEHPQATRAHSARASGAIDTVCIGFDPFVGCALRRGAANFQHPSDDSFTAPLLSYLR
jgi:hypothetical protein